MNAATKKIAAVCAIVTLLTLNVAVLDHLSADSEADRELDMIARVNEEGSLIFVREDLDPDGFCTYDEEEGRYHYTPGTWDMKIFGTPGITSIQHKMLERIVVEDLGFQFIPYTKGEERAPGHVYFVQNLTNVPVWEQTKFLDGGTVWEPVCSGILDSKRPATEIINTGRLEPNHTCCVVAGTHSYLSAHPDRAARFLAAYVESVDLLNEALENGPGDTDYEDLVELAMKSTKQERNIVEEALHNVKYTYGNDGEGDSDGTPLVSLRASIADFASSSNLSTPIDDLGFGEGRFDDFADLFVDDSYLSEAIGMAGSGEKKDYDYVRIRVAVIGGDIHQIALHFGVEKGIFSRYNVGLSVNPASNGAGVVTSLQNGAASIGFMGAPPITLTCINSKLDVCRAQTLSGTAVDADGSPAAGAEVRIVDAQGDVSTAAAGADGRFSVEVQRGSYNPDEGAITIECGDLIYTSPLARVGADADLGRLVLAEAAA